MANKNDTNVFDNYSKVYIEDYIGNKEDSIDIGNDSLQSKIIVLAKQRTYDFIRSPQSKWKNREFYRHIRILQSIQASVDSVSQSKIDELIDKLNFVSLSLDYSDQQSHFCEESVYWKGLAMQDSDHTYITSAECDDIELRDSFYTYAAALNTLLVGQFDPFYSYDYAHTYKIRAKEVDNALAQFDHIIEWEFVDYLIDNQVEPTNLFDEPDEQSDAIQTHPEFVFLNSYRRSLLYFDEASQDKISTVFWQNEFDKFNSYCVGNGLLSMVQLFDIDLIVLCNYGLSHAKISQIADTMSIWAENTIHSSTKIQPDKIQPDIDSTR